MDENKSKNSGSKNERTFDEGTHPGAYTVKHDINNKLLDTVDSSDKIFIENESDQGEPANHASPPAGDPPVPNRAHTGI